MSDQVISYADLSIINTAIQNISTDISEVNSELLFLTTKQENIEDVLNNLVTTFTKFVKNDSAQKTLQLAETRQGNLKQDLEIKYGYYAEVRRMAAGILQGVDAGVITDDTLRFATEEVMIKAPGYWLAPCLVALAAWIRNDKTINERALNEGLKRDDYKATLFFLLVMRRVSRLEASMKWLERYFLHQNPHNLKREFIVILEAVSTGIFPPASRNLMMSHIKNWLAMLTDGDSFIDEQKRQWVSFFAAIGPLYDDRYPLLEKYSPDWKSLEKSRREAKAYKVLLRHFNNIFDSSFDFSKAIKNQLDEILSLLVTNFDEEELPLQKEIRLNQLIIQMDGDKDAARAMMDVESHLFEEEVDFLQMLTNAAFDPEKAGATKVTQALAVSIAQPWIVEAFDEFSANCRNSTLPNIRIEIENYNTNTTDGADETEQLQKYKQHWDRVLEKELAALSLPIGNMVIGGVLALIGLIFLISLPIIGLASLIIGGVLIWTTYDKNKKAKDILTKSILDKETRYTAVLRGCLAEIVDYRKEYAEEDGNAEELRQLINSITPADFSSVSVGTKTILTSN